MNEKLKTSRQIFDYVCKYIKTKYAGCGDFFNIKLYAYSLIAQGKNGDKSKSTFRLTYHSALRYVEIEYEINYSVGLRKESFNYFEIKSENVNNLIINIDRYLNKLILQAIATKKGKS